MGRMALGLELNGTIRNAVNTMGCIMAANTLHVGAFSRRVHLVQSDHHLCQRLSNSGSFIRLSAKGLSYGRSFLPALLEKYVESLAGSGSEVESVVLGSSNGSITVEAPRLDKIRANLSRIESLREASLDGESISGVGDDEIKIRATCSSEYLFSIYPNVDYI